MELGYFDVSVLSNCGSDIGVYKVSSTRAVRISYYKKESFELATKLSNPDIWPDLKLLTRVYKVTRHNLGEGYDWQSIEMPLYTMLAPDSDYSVVELDFMREVKNDYELYYNAEREYKRLNIPCVLMDCNYFNFGFDRGGNLKLVDLWGAA